MSFEAASRPSPTPVLACEPLPAGVGQLGDLDSSRPLGDFQWREVGLGEIAVVGFGFFRSHRDRDAPRFIPVAGLLFDLAAALEGVSLPGDLVGQGLLCPLVTGDVLHLGAVRRAQSRRRDRSVRLDLAVRDHRDVRIDSERAVPAGVEDPQVFEYRFELREKPSHFRRISEIGFGDDLHEGDARAIVIDQGVLRSVDARPPAIAGVLEAAGVFL